jgi:hypothetical protein
MENKTSQQTFTISEITKIITQKMPVPFISPGQRGNPELFLPAKLRAVLFGIKPVDTRYTTGRNGVQSGRAAGAYSFTVMKDALEQVEQQLDTTVGTKFLAETKPHLHIAITSFVSDHTRE